MEGIKGRHYRAKLGLTVRSLGSSNISDRQYARAGCPALFQISVSARRLSQWISLINLELYGAREQDREKGIGGVDQFGVRARVMDQRGAG
jgi:hypothetical protein